MNKPILMAVDKDETSLLFVEQELRKRYGADYEVICDPSAETALSLLQVLKDEDREVALLLAHIRDTVENVPDQHIKSAVFAKIPDKHLT